MLAAGPGLRRKLAHCPLHRSQGRHITFELCLVKDTGSVNCNRFADSADMHAETLWTTNTCEDSEHQWKFNEEGLRFMTASSDLIVQSAPEPAREMAPEQVAKQARTANGVGKVALMQSGPNMPVAADSTMRKQKRSKVKKAPPVSSAADCTSSEHAEHLH